MQTRVSRKALLAYGILASLTYFASDILASLRYPTYNFSDQAVSELIAIGAPTGAQASTPDLGNECATCHLRLAWTRSVTTHVDLWVTSQHAFYRVGCEKCHGGDPGTSDVQSAHRGVVRSAEPSSSVHRTALPMTCGRCHRTEAVAFDRSAHRTALSRGDPAAPTCTSCHTSMATEIPSLTALEKQCLDCHRDDPQNRAQVARRQVEESMRLSVALRRTKLDVDVIKNAERRTSLTEQWADAGRSLRDVVAGIHTFDQQRVEERLIGARAQVNQLRAELARR
jgi:hypothetical protein